MENGPLEDVSPIKNGGLPASYISLPEGNSSSHVTHQLQLQEVSPEYSVPSSDLEGLLRRQTVHDCVVMFS